MPFKHFHQSESRKKSTKRTFHLFDGHQSRNLLRLLQPGAFVRLENHPSDLPPFQLISCRGGRCLVRQQSWGKNIHWEVEHHRLESA